MKKLNKITILYFFILFVALPLFAEEREVEVNEEAVVSKRAEQAQEITRYSAEVLPADTFRLGLGDIGVGLGKNFEARTLIWSHLAGLLNAGLLYNFFENTRYSFKGGIFGRYAVRIADDGGRRFSLDPQLVGTYFHNPQFHQHVSLGYTGHSLYTDSAKLFQWKYYFVSRPELNLDLTPEIRLLKGDGSYNNSILFHVGSGTYLRGENRGKLFLSLVGASYLWAWKHFHLQLGAGFDYYPKRDSKVGFIPLLDLYWTL